MERNCLSKRTVLFPLCVVWCLVPTAHGLEWAQQAKIEAEGGALGDSFGFSVAISGDTAVLGAPWRNENGASSGSAYVFQWNGSQWAEMTKLVPDDLAAEDHFGFAVAVSGNTAIVGVSPDEEVHGNCGWAYLFQRSDSQWTQVTKLGPKCGGFGRSVAISGETLIAGAPEQVDEKSNAAGSAYIFQKTDSGWTEAARVVAADGEQGDRFGQSVSISGNTAIIGASGSAYMFEQTGKGWTEVSKLLAEDNEEGTNAFGASVSISDGRAIVGADRDDDNGSSSGAAYVFEHIKSEWTHVAKLLASDGQPGDAFGASVSISGATAILGARRDDDDGSSSGSAYIFGETESGWPEIAKLRPSDPAQLNIFGSSVSLDAGTALIGAPGHGPPPSSGAAYVFVVPEPSSVALLLAAGAGLLLFTLSRRR